MVKSKIMRNTGITLLILGLLGVYLPHIIFLLGVFFPDITFLANLLPILGVSHAIFEIIVNTLTLIGCVLITRGI